MYDLNGTIEYNTDGTGKTSCWGLEQIGKHYERGTKYFIYMFTNDEFHLMQPGMTAACYYGIYEYVAANGTTPVPVIAVLRSPASDDVSDQVAYLGQVQGLLDTMKIPYVKMYDAIDSMPGNGQIDDYVAANYQDGTHPTEAAQRMMGQYLWRNL